MLNFKSAQFLNHARRLIGDNYCFLPDTTPLRSLPSQFNKVQQACSSISTDYSITGIGVRNSLDQIFAEVDPDLMHSITTLTLPQKQYLMSILSILAHCYRWDLSPPADVTASQVTLKLPAELDAMWRLTAAECGQPVVGTNASLKYWNWHLVGKPQGSSYRPQDLLTRKVSVNHLWLSGQANATLENWILTFILAEAGGAKVIKCLLFSMQLAINEETEKCLASLQCLYASIIEFNKLIGRLLKGTRVNADIWLKQIQHTFAWGIAVPETGEKLQGPSGMQVGVIQTLNLGLRIPGNTENLKMSQQTRQYYSPQQQQFFDHIIAHASSLTNLTERYDDISSVYNDCIDELARWRVSHQKRGAWFLKKTGSETNEKRISTGLSLTVDVDGTEKFIEMIE